MKRIGLLALFLWSAAGQALDPVVFMTDFGQVDDAVAICKGVMLGIEPRLTIVDLLHDVTPYSVEDGARFLAGAAAYYPKGTVFVGVVDPGVGSSRRAVVALSQKGHRFVVPDNGLLTLIQDRDGLKEVREIANPKWLLKEAVSSTFHGRDIFAPVGARLAKGGAMKEVGKVVEVSSLVRLEVPQPKMTEAGLEGDIIALDGPFGNLITNIGSPELQALGVKVGEEISISIGRRRIRMPWVKTFSDVPVGKPLFYLDSKGFLALAVNQGNFAREFEVTPPKHVVLHKREP